MRIYTVNGHVNAELRIEECEIISSALQKYRDHANVGRFSSTSSNTTAARWAALAKKADELRLGFWKTALAAARDD